jgi:hypothetical protein
MKFLSSHDEIFPFGIRKLYEKSSAGGSAAIKSSCEAT